MYMTRCWQRPTSYYQEKCQNRHGIAPEARQPPIPTNDTELLRLTNAHDITVLTGRFLHEMEKPRETRDGTK
jgi:hypothetical protein